MNLHFFRKNNNNSDQVVNAKNNHVLPDKPYSETGPRPKFLWKILLFTYIIVGFCLFAFIIFSYQFLTKERTGVVENSPNSNPKINATKIEKINSFFNERSKFIESSYQKAVVDPGLN